ncbi:PIR protein [Plasmodium ovale]|uniref:PIR protein n=1 Tax=Plasmodium ovale TaxID=36330 RepID=A0A1D3JE68_PLAOA|nr:PIR protein [Plasmodium ovale]
MTKYKVASSNKLYKEKLSSYSSGAVPANIRGCDNSSIEHISVTINDFPKLCSTAIQFLTYLKENSDTYRDEGCKYLYYWLYVEKFTRNISMENISILYKTLNDIFNKNNNGLNSLNNYINKTTINTFDKLVKLTELYEKFNQFMTDTTQRSPERKCQSDCFNLYTKHVHECRNGDDKDFCYELKNFREQHNAYIQTVLDCKEEQYILPPVYSLDTSSIILISLALILVTSFILPLLYKFIPFGPWIHHKLAKKKNTWDNISQEENHFTHNYEYDREVLEKPHYKLAYNSS